MSRDGFKSRVEALDFRSSFGLVMAPKKEWPALVAIAAEADAEINKLQGHLGEALQRVAEKDAEIAALKADAARYLAFFDAGLPITFMGVEHYDKKSLDAAIDAHLNGGEHGA